VDRLDIAILQSLVNDSMMSFSELARNLSVSTDTVIRRYKKMKKSGLIKRPTIVIDVLACGYFGYIAYFVEITGKTESSCVEAELVKIPNFALLVKSMPPFSFYVEFFVRNFENIADITRTISKIAGIKKATFIFYPRTGPLVYEIPYKEMYQGQAAILKENGKGN